MEVCTYMVLVVASDHESMQCKQIHRICKENTDNMSCPSLLQETAFEENQKYKEGKFIVEKARVIKVRTKCETTFAPT